MAFRPQVVVFMAVCASASASSAQRPADQICVGDSTDLARTGGAMIQTIADRRGAEILQAANAAASLKGRLAIVDKDILPFTTRGAELEDAVGSSSSAAASASHDDVAEASSLPDSFLFPKIIHMTARNEFGFFYMDQWLRKNPGWKADKLTSGRQADLMKERCPVCDDFFQNGSLTKVERADVVRILALDKEGGVYLDNDVMDRIPIEEWLSHFGYPSNVQMVLGTEFPTPSNGNPFQLESWTIMSVPNNPILKLALKRILNNLRTMPNTQENIVKRTGPAALTSAVIEAMRDGGAALPTLEEINGGSGHLATIIEPDNSTLRVVFLPYRAAGYHPDHSKYFVKEPRTDQVVEHQFDGAWRSL